jgi:SOS-response transcriptional repressor LexA
MYAHLNPRTRKIVEELLIGGSPTAGGHAVAVFNESQRRLLDVIARTFSSLQRGGDLAKQIEKELVSAPPILTTNDIPDPATGRADMFWRFGTLNAHSFRGLAPAGHVWTYDFKGKSHLMHGPNGCGKSSLMGAVAWVLTGRLFRDDCEPCPPEAIEIFTTGEKAKSAGTRPCALTLTDALGVNTPVNAAYWVELQLLPGNGSLRTTPVWIRRHRSDGLSTSDDGTNWRKIETVEEVGISELDTELHVLMPARVPHLSFGKRPELVRLFAQVVGLDDLEAIAEAAKSVHMAFTRTANNIEKETLTPLRTRVTELTAELDRLASSEIKAVDGYAAVTAATVKLEDVGQIGKRISDILGEARTTLAASLGLGISGDGGGGDPEFAEQLKLLPGQVGACLLRLDQPLEKLFSLALQAGQPTPEDVELISEKLAAFARSSRDLAVERAKWARREQAEPDLQLMLAAANQFDEVADSCPVCHRPMVEAPVRRSALLELKSVKGHEHLQRQVSDLELCLISEFHSIIPATQMKRAEKGMQQRLQEDWATVKQNVCSGLLLQIAERLDTSISMISSCPAGAGPQVPTTEKMPSGFSKLAAAIADGERYLTWAREMNAQAGRVRSELERVVRTDNASLRHTVEAGRKLSDDIGTLSQLHQAATKLWQTLKEIDQQSAKAREATAIAAAAAPIKDLGDLARKEAFEVVKGVDPEVRRYYALLYGNEVLELDLITPGHAANRSVKTEINAYFKVGKERVPIAPFSNAGRLRGIMLAFVFALLKHSRNSIGLIILDDPALSMDDEHKSRFADHLIAPIMVDRQVLLATHYENFFKAAETHFRSGERLNIVPKRSRKDAVNFEPADLLARLEQFVARPTASWREAATNLRIWAERTLAALSAYAPEPFTVFNNATDTVLAYKRIADDRIATDRRDKIVAALESPQFERVRNRAAHDEEPTESDVRDALRVLQAVSDDVDFELKRLKGLHRHSVLGRGLGKRPCLESLPIATQVAPREIEITGRAAAASGGAAVQWLESSFIKIPELPCVLVLDHTLAPTCGRGDVAILDLEDAPVSNADLVAIATDEGQLYLRRFWGNERGVQLESVNPTASVEPIYLGTGLHRVRKIAGVIFASMNMRGRLEPGREWTPLNALPPHLLADVMGVRVSGVSLDPLARDGQIVLVRKHSVNNVESGTLACVDIEDAGAVIKRCYPVGEQWVLNPVNPVEVVEPIVANARRILHVYPVVGVLFSVRGESTT